MRTLSTNEVAAVSGAGAFADWLKSVGLVKVDVNVNKTLGQVLVSVLAPFTKVNVNVNK